MMRKKTVSLPNRIVRDVLEGRLGNSRGEVTPSEVVKRYSRTKFAKSYLSTVLKNGETTSDRDAGRAFVSRVSKGVYVVTKEAREQSLAQR
jgi:hypothetical protein